jgi:nucleoside-diphosphate-sugar epimerase
MTTARRKRESTDTLYYATPTGPSCVAPRVTPLVTYRPDIFVILVTGGTGFVGRRVVDRLSAHGERVRVLTRMRTSAQRLPRGVDIVEASLLDPSSLTPALAGVDRVIHLAAVLSGERVVDVNVTGTRALAAAAREAGVRHVVHCSSAGVYGDGDRLDAHRETDAPHPQSAYERSKLEGERAIVETLDGHVRWTILRPAGVYGPGRPATIAFLRQVERRRVWLHGLSTVVVHPTFVDDVAEAIVAVVSRADLAGTIINVGGATALTYPRLIDETAHALGTAVRHVHTPALVGRLVRAGRALHELPPQCDRLGRAVINRAVDTALAARLLGLTPVPLASGLAATVGAYRAGAHS